MPALYLILLSAAGLISASMIQQWRSGGIDEIPKSLKAYSVAGLAIGILWMAIRTPFWRHAFITISAMLFACFMLPNEMTFFARNPSLVLALPFVAGFVAANYRRSGVGAIASIAVIAITTLASYRIAQSDPVIGPWVRSAIMSL